MSDLPRPVPAALRERIAMVRVLCIGFMIYVHVPDNAISALSSGVPLPSRLFQGFLVEGVGRSSAALLSFVSGLLTAIALARCTLPSLYRRRFRSIVLPMLVWSTATVTLYAFISLVQPTFLALEDRTPGEAALYYLNTVLFVTEQPMGPTLHLGFLRDLFVCIVLSPLLLAAVRRIGAMVPVLLGALYLADVESIIMLRPLVLFAFSIGVWLADGHARLDRVDRFWPLWVVLSILATSLTMLSGSEQGLDSRAALWFDAHGVDLRESVVYPASRLFGALAIWTLAARLVGGSWARRIAAVSPYVFVAFCSHFLVLTLLWEGFVRRLVHDTTTPAYTAWFTVAPLVAMIGAAMLVELMARLAPRFAALLTGGRVGSGAGALAPPQTGAATASTSVADTRPSDPKSASRRLPEATGSMPVQLPQ